MAEPTPGPWMVKDDALVFGRSRRYSDDRMVANCAAYQDNSDPTVRAENAANARLIAKARHLPELVEALQDLDNCLVFAVPVTKAGVMIIGQDAIDLHAAMTKAAAALALVQETE